MQPEESRLIQTRTAVVQLRPDGVVGVRVLPEVMQFLDDARQNLDAAVALAGTVRRPLLVDIRMSRVLDPEARHHYARTPLHHSFTAVGMLINASPLGRMMGNVYLKIARHRVATRLFEEEAQALTWLLAPRKS